VRFLGLELRRYRFSGLLGATLLALLAAIYLHPELMLSPGALVAGHGELAGDCLACHAPFHGAARARCLQCHVLGDIGLRSVAGMPIQGRILKASFHASLNEPDCMACHTDHHGPVLARRSREPFSHLSLQAAARARCSDCHAAPAETLHRRPTANCAQCHGEDRWKPASFDHAQLFFLDHDHAVKCTICHAGRDYAHYSCYGCHQHTPDGMRAAHLRIQIDNFDNCVGCHRDARRGAPR
jgi:hypothetical protein